MAADISFVKVLKPVLIGYIDLTAEDGNELLIHAALIVQLVHIIMKLLNAEHIAMVCNRHADETDKVLFPDRPLPSGRVRKKELMVSCVIVQVITVALNVLFMNNLPFFVILYAYGYLMSKWFFQRAKIQPSLPLALVTHNPVQMIVNLYIISFTVIKYGIPAFSLTNCMALMTLYFPALIWEVSRKIKAPKDENDYTTYSKLFGYRRATRFVMILTIVDILTNFIIVYRLNLISVAVLFLLVSWMTWKFIQYMKNPERFVLVDKVEIYTYLQESTMLLTIGAFLLFGKIG